MCGRTVCLSLLACMAFLSLGTGVGLLAGHNALLRAVLSSQLPLSSTDSKLWGVFLNPTNEGVTFQRKFTIFNVTNPNEVCGGAPPNLNPIGPYVFNQVHNKPTETINWPDKNTVDYDYTLDFTFDTASSIDAATGRQLFANDSIMYYNVAMFGAAYRIKGIDPNLYPPPPMNTTPVPSVCAGYINLINTECITDQTSGILQVHSVEEYLFGYTDPLWSILQSQIADNNIDFYVPSFARMQFSHVIPAPEPITADQGQRCPMWDNQSVCAGTGNAPSSIMTGADNLDNIGKMTQWAGQADGKLSWWGPGCQGFNGATDGTQFKPGLTKGLH